MAANNFKIIVSARAEQDIRSLVSNLLQNNPVAAERLLKQLEQAIDGLSFTPMRHKPGYIQGTRELISVKNYVIIFRIDKNLGNVDILSIWHQAQDRQTEN